MQHVSSMPAAANHVSSMPFCADVGVPSVAPLRGAPQEREAARTIAVASLPFFRAAFPMRTKPDPKQTSFFSNSISWQPLPAQSPTSLAAAARLVGLCAGEGCHKTSCKKKLFCFAYGFVLIGGACMSVCDDNDYYGQTIN